LTKPLSSSRIYPLFPKLFRADGNANDADVAVKLLNQTCISVAQEDIDEKLKEMSWIPSIMRGNNQTRLAVDLIEFGRIDDEFEDDMERWEESPSIKGSNGEFTSVNSTITPPFASLFDQFGGDIVAHRENLVEDCYPKECRQEGEEPTEAEAKIFLQDVLAKERHGTDLVNPKKFSVVS